MANTFHCSVITPERNVLECDATFVAIPAHDGEIGILSGRAPLVCKLGIGTLRVEVGDEKHVFLVDQGFAQVLENRVSILTQHAYKADELDREAASLALAEAVQMKISDEASLTARSNAVQRAKAEIKLARSHD